MSNKASSQLHDLIKAMTRAEKRYYKLFAERHHTGDNHLSLQLFNQVGKQSVYDEAALLEHFKDQPVSQHFSLAKNRLYRQLLKSLAAFHQQQSIEAELGQMIHQAEILYKKALYPQSEKLLNSAQKLAERYENHGALLQIIKRQKRLAERDHYESSKGKTINDIHLLEQHTLQQAALEAELWLAKSQIFFNLFKRGQAREELAHDDLEQLMAAVVDKARAEDSSFETRYLALQIQSVYAFTSGDYKATYRSLTDNLTLLDAHEERVSQEPEILVAVLANLAYVCAKLNLFEEVDTLLVRSRALPAQLKDRISEDLENTIFTHSHSLELAICNLTGNLDRGMKVVGRLEASLSDKEHTLSAVRKAALYHGMSTMYLLGGDARSALKWNNILLNEISIEKTEDQYCFALIFHQLLHLELGNYSVLPYTLRSLERYLETRSRKFRFEQNWIQFVKQAVQAEENAAHWYKALSDFAEAIRDVDTDPLEKTVLEYFDFQTWATSKSTGEAMTKLLQTKTLRS